MVRKERNREMQVKKEWKEEGKRAGSERGGETLCNVLTEQG